ncbi:MULTISPECIES: DUF2147 domain-containing protein [Rhodomicrobium]|uniref:DUF2147 domain-containing protein n=1 Tax=Rhodomicrobium TaxID=1068 RepID=UPI000B4AA0C3|nr:MULTISPECIES: DUF2147 domain-containing protein [Rhodomicrobium]
MRVAGMALGAGLLLICASGPSFAQSAEDALGVWENPENGSHIQIAKCGGGVCATVVKVKDPSRTDTQNPDPQLRKRPIKGIVIMNGATKSDAKTWSGKLYNTQDGQTYSGTLSVVDKNHVKLQGCVMGGLVCKGPTWNRVQ